MVTWSLALKDLLVLIRDRRALVALLAMPFVFLVVLGVSLGEGFGQKPDERLRVSIVDLDQGYEEANSPSAPATAEKYPPATWAKVIQDDLAMTAGIRIEVIPTRAQAEALIRSSSRSAVLVFGPNYSQRVHECSFLAKGINPFYRDGVELARLDVEILRDPTQLAAASIIEQVAQVATLRVVLPWMIGRAFEQVGNVMGPFVKGAIKQQFPNYDLTAKTWAALCKAEARPPGDSQITVYTGGEAGGVLHRGSYRYQVLVPAYTVMFAFFLVMTCGWLFASERRQGTLKRLRAAPVSRPVIVLGKLIPCFVLALAQGAFLFLAGRIVFGMSWGPEPAWLIAVIVATALAATGMALLLAAVTRTETQVMVLGSMLVLAMAGLSGCLMPRELMPEQMKVISRVTPHAWALDAYSQLLLNPDPNLAMVMTSCLALAGFGIGFFALAVALLRLD